MRCYMFTIPGKPTGKARPRVTRNGAYTPEQTVMYENLVKIMAKESMRGGPMLEGPIGIDVIAVYSIPKAVSKRQRELMLAGRIRPTKKPDIDNVLKIIGDALNGICYKDDSEIVTAHIDKRYGEIAQVCVDVGEIRTEDAI